MPTTTPRYDTVLVIGASIGGLLAAAAASRYADRVVLVDHDRLPDRPEPRPSTPQALHSHGLLGSGRRAMEELLPGFTDRMLGTGALSADIGTTGRWYVGGGLLADVELGLTGLAASRHAIEHALRELVRELPRTELHDEVDVVRLCGDAERVTGAVLRRRGTDQETWELAADLVVDASGRAGRAARWLPALGATAPEEVRVAVGVRYVTLHVQAEEDDLDGRVVVVSAATPECPHVGVAIRQEDRTWTVTLAGYGDEPMPSDPDGLRSAAGRILAPEIATLLAGRDSLHEPVHYRFPDCRRRRFEAVALPLGYAPIGDAVCSFDPTFGQGMSVAALEAVALAEELGRGLEAVRRRYPRRAAGIVESAWAVVLGTVLDLPGVTGERPRGHRLIARYVGAVQRAARTDPAAARAFFEVMNLVVPPQSLMTPRVAVRALRPRSAA